MGGQFFYHSFFVGFVIFIDTWLFVCYTIFTKGKLLFLFVFYFRGLTIYEN